MNDELNDFNIDPVQKCVNTTCNMEKKNGKAVV